MVPGSTLMYGSSFIRRTLRPRASRIAPRHAEVMPLPSEDTTPPGMKMNRVTFLPMGALFPRVMWAAWAARRGHVKLGPNAGAVAIGVRPSTDRLIGGDGVTPYQKSSNATSPYC